MTLLLGLLLPVTLVQADEVTRRVQEELRKRNLYFGDVDGKNRDQLVSALRRYQQRKGFDETGVADENTLRSLSLLGPPPSVVEEAKIKTSPEKESVVVVPAPWPDVPVLRSDEGRRMPIPPDLSVAGVEETPVPPTPAPPPAAARRAESVKIRGFVEHYLQAGAANDADAEMRFYGREVDYFGEGVVDRQFLEKDVRQYDQRWPHRKFAVVGPVLSNEDPNKPGTFRVQFRYRFTNQGKGNPVSGQADQQWTIVANGSDSFNIVAMKEQRVLP